ncbi:Non-specific serine/threonine protein kinase [Caligus rogercresseyi]|uniref:Non-specific serine/threonine protein kinase n=1 Tax=Caligus rogercresseyi TaxID=217165 RepID=A0A7T8QVN0_CALRO|nr:Non-specific serine/threonine protein kinase [Caligus rogercresseyi]
MGYDVWKRGSDTPGLPTATTDNHHPSTPKPAPRSVSRDKNGNAGPSASEPLYELEKKGTSVIRVSYPTGPLRNLTVITFPSEEDSREEDQQQQQHNNKNNNNNNNSMEPIVHGDEISGETRRRARNSPPWHIPEPPTIALEIYLGTMPTWGLRALNSLPYWDEDTLEK